MNDKYLSIATINRYLKNKLDSDPNLQTVYLRGEISNFKNHTTGHLYFSLKDETSKINAIMFASSARKLKFMPADGMKVLVKGRISLFEAAGSYQIYVDEMDEDGMGNLYLAFLKLKEKLDKEGLFDPAHKRPLPSMPEKIGIITAPTGAAVKDVVSTIKRRFPICETILFPSLVQGPEAAKDIVQNIELAQTYDLDLLIVGRGGGSIEDLWPFNEEIVARAIYNSKIPVISGVGHEIDFTIADFVADMRAPTPTGAAEMAVPNMMDVLNQIKSLSIRGSEAINKKINYNKLYLDSIKNSFVIKNPMMMYDAKRQNLDTMLDTLNRDILNVMNSNQVKLDKLSSNLKLYNPKYKIDENKKNLNQLTIDLNRSMQLVLTNNTHNLDKIITKLELINPIGVLKRGYSITYKDGTSIKSSKDVNVNDLINIKLEDGNIDAKVIDKGE